MEEDAVELLEMGVSKLRAASFMVRSEARARHRDPGSHTGGGPWTWTGTEGDGPHPFA